MLDPRWKPLMLAAGAALALAACKPPADDVGRQPRIVMIIYGTTGNPFWSKVVAGAREAADDIGADVNVQFAGSDPVQQNNLIEAAIANKVDGIGVVVDQPGAYDRSLSQARGAGIPVIAFNIDASARRAGPQAFVGQDFEVAGYALGRRVAAEAKLQAGDRAVCPVEHPEATYATRRHAGVERALREVGASCEVISTGGIGLEDTLTKLSQYLIGHPATDAVIALGSLPTEAAPQAIREARLDIPNAGFDLSRAIVQNVVDGRTLAVVDQQPFYQGYFTVAQLHFAASYGLAPANINTGAAIVDRSNAKAALALADSVR